MQVIANGGGTQPQLFRAAMISSACINSQFIYDDAYYEAVYAEVVNQANCSNATDSLQCLRQADYSILEDVNTNVTSSMFFGGLAFSPIVDGEFITESPSALIAAGKVNGPALLAVTNSFEGTIFVPDDLDTMYDVESYAAQQWPKMTPDERSELASTYASTGTNIEQLRPTFGEAVFVCTTHRLLSAFEGRAHKAEFAILPALHGRDLVYYFSGGDRGPPPYNNTDFINAFAQSFLNFVTSMDPNVKFDSTNISPDWPLYRERGLEMVFNRTSDDVPDIQTRATDTGLLEHCSFWETDINPVGQ